MHVVVVGGGQAGLGAAVALSKARPKNVPVEITLVDPKDYFEVRWAAVRALFDPAVRKGMQTMYDKLLPKHNIVHLRDSVAAVNKTSLALKGGSTLKFDVCLYAVGATCQARGVDPVAPYEATARRTQLAECGEALAGKRTLVVGGGALGCEFAGELAAHAESVALVHAGNEVAEQLRPVGRHLVHRKLAELGVNVLVSRRATQDADGRWTATSTASAKGTSGPADDTAPELRGIRAAMRCTGYAPRNAALTAGDLGTVAVDGDGWALTDEQFRVAGSGGRIFAFGDCCTTGAQDAATIFANCGVMAHNLRTSLVCLANGRSLNEIADGKLRRAKRAPKITILTLGAAAGVADTPLGAFHAFLPSLKNRSLFISRALAFVS